jgi:pimeloyl-ACP methyl ester carboxylesterase
VVLLPGGDGHVGIGEDGAIADADNFLVRTRNQWLALGYAYAMPDAPSGSPSLTGRRRSDQYAAAVDAVVARLRDLYGVPVWLVGTSQGAIAAASTAARFDHVAGVVLASPVTEPGRSGETLFDVRLADIRVPALVLTNAHDACRTSPPDDAPRVVAALVHAHPSDAMTFDSMQAGGPACGPWSPHGFMGIEPTVLDKAAAWMAAAGQADSR